MYNYKLMEQNDKTSTNKPKPNLTLRQIINQHNYPSSSNPKAHPNKTSTKHNISHNQQTTFEASMNTFLKKQQLKNISVDTNEVKQCKICLENEQGEGDRLVSPCGCDGSLKFVHCQCFQIWINKKYQNQRQNEVQNDDGKWASCQICHQKYDISYHIGMYCAEWQKIITKLRQLWIFALLTTFVWSSSLLLLIWCIYMAIIDLQSPQFNLFQKRFFSIYFALLFSFCSFYWVLRQFITCFLIQTKITIKINETTSPNPHNLSFLNRNNDVQQMKLQINNY